MISTVQLLSQKPTRPTQTRFESEDGQPMRRRDRRRKSEDGGDFSLIEFGETFKPTKELVDLRKEGAKARLKVIRAYTSALASGNGKPNFARLEKLLRGPLSLATQLQIQYQEAEVRAREDHRKRVEEASRRIGEHQEAERSPMVFKLGGPTVEFLRFEEDEEGIPRPKEFRKTETLKFLGRTRDEQRSASEARKAKLRRERRERREMWRRRRIAAVASTIRAEAEEAFADDDISSENFRSLTKALAEIQESDNPMETAAEAFADDLIDRVQYHALKGVCR